MSFYTRPFVKKPSDEFTEQHLENLKGDSGKYLDRVHLNTFSLCPEQLRGSISGF